MLDVYDQMRLMQAEYFLGRAIKEDPSQNEIREAHRAVKGLLEDTTEEMED